MYWVDCLTQKGTQMFFLDFVKSGIEKAMRINKKLQKLPARIEAFRRYGSISFVTSYTKKNEKKCDFAECGIFGKLLP